MTGGRAPERALREIRGLARAGLDTAAFAEQVQGVLQSVVPHAAACVVTVDPATTLLTGTYKFGDLAGKHERDREWALLEYGEEEPTAMAALARREVPAAAISQVEGGAEGSPRARALFGPPGYRDELRVVARDEGHTWGGINLFRGRDERDFDEHEVRILASSSATIAAGLRSGLLARLAADARHPSDTGPAVMIVGPEGELLQVSLGADDVLQELMAEENRSPASAFVHGLVAGARRYAAGRTDVLPRVRVRVPTGRWLVAHAAPLAGPAGASRDVVVTLEEARPPEIVPLLVAAFHLSSREREVTQLVLQGLDTKAIASELHMSSYTVQDHLKSVFDKADVRSRRELMARVFFDQYAPRLTADLAPSGWFRDTAPR